MAWKTLKPNNHTDSKLFQHQALKELDDIQTLVDWSKLETLLANIYSSPKGEKAWPPPMMFKAMLLQSWYKLSDPALEKQLARDLLFKNFVGLPISETVPDHTTLWRYRRQLEKRSLLTPLLNEINQQLAQQGLYTKSGTVSIIDASVIEAKQCRPKTNQAGQSTQDPEASWNVKTASDGKRKTTYGSKAHPNVDEDGSIKATDFTSGSTHDSNCFTNLLEGDESAAYADSAYKSEQHDQWLEKRGIENRVIRRAYRNRPLSPADRRFNRLHSGVRSTVERVFGVLKQHYGMAKARYLGVGRNRTRFGLMCVAHNLKRGLSIKRASCA